MNDDYVDDDKIFPFLNRLLKWYQVDGSYYIDIENKFINIYIYNIYLSPSFGNEIRDNDILEPYDVKIILCKSPEPYYLY